MNFIKACLKTVYWKKRSNFLLPLLIISLFASCKKSDDLYLDTQDDTGKNVQITDTFTIELITERQARSVISNLEYDILGAYMDPVLGRTTAGIFTQLRQATGTPPDFSDQPALDSFVLVLEYLPGKQLTGNIAKPQTFRVYELDQSLSENTQYLNDTNIRIIPQQTGEYTGTVNTTDNTLRINITGSNEALAKKFFNADPKSFNDASSFASFLKGIAIIPDSAGLASGEGALLPFATNSSNSSLILYYHTAKASGQKYSMNMTTGAVRLNKYWHNYKGTRAEDQLAKPDNKYTEVYVQGLAGLRTRVRFPNIKELVKDGTLTIHNAQIILPKVDSAADAQNDNVPAALLLYPRDAEGNTVTTGYLDPSLPYYDGTWSASAQQYKFGITLYIQSIVNGYYKGLKFNDYGLNLRTTPDAPVSTARAILTTQQNTQHRKPRLVLTYTKIADK